MRKTIGDVAKEAGVSISTVSRVINGNYPVKESTRERVQAVIDEMQFEPNVLARGLIHRKSNTIGVVVPSITNLFFPLVVKAIEQTIRKKGYHLYLCDTDADPIKERSYIKSLKSRQVDGIIVIDPTIENIKNSYFEEMSKTLPLVLINGYNQGIDCNFVLNDEAVAGAQVMDYLMSLGHKNIAFIRGENSYSYDVKEEIYMQKMTDYHLQDYIHILNIGEGNTEHTVNEAMKEGQRFLENKPNVTAVFACNDIMALGIIRACQKLGKQVPEDVSVIGFDNIDLSVLVSPKLTTVDQNMDQLGTHGASMLLDMIDEKAKIKETRRIVVKSRLIKRESCQQME